MVLACGAFSAHAQVRTNLRVQKLRVDTAAITLDSMSIVPGTFSIDGVPDSTFLLDYVGALLKFNKLPATDSVTLRYRTFPAILTRPVYRYRFDSIVDFFKAAPVRPTDRYGSANKERFIDFGNLNYTGSFGRSLSFGNNQDAVVNSLFNLQLNGMLGDSIEVAAAITDNNIPILPDGTTQQLNEFDRIWLQFKKRPWELNIGDIDIRQQPSYFMSYFKRQQGLAFQTNMQLTKKISNKMLASGAIAKGKFTRNIFNGQEANQGPYRLEGANNAFFFIVLPGTERVFVDGVMQQRGEDQDYIINYNTAEITFTPRQLINKDKRIQVEFEYADRNYLNSLLFVGNELKVGSKLDVNLAFYANTDAKNATININLDQEQRQFLSEIGDSINKALYPSAVLDTFDINKILYIKKDSLVNGSLLTIYEYSATQAAEMFSLSFAQVGAGNGNYVPLFDATNGRAFRFVAPINGVQQGDYEPVQLLVTPKQQQLGTALIRYRLSNKTTLLTEAAVSRWDINRFSSRDKGNDLGTGIKIQLEDARGVKLAGKSLQLETAFGYEYVSEKFRPLERLRNVEFYRDWGLPFETGVADEQLPSLRLQLGDSGRQKFTYKYNGYIRSDGYTGNRHELDHQFQYRGWQLNDVFLVTAIEGKDFNGYFLRPQVRLQKTFEKWNNYSFQFSYNLEHNELNQSLADTLLPVSFSFRDWNATIRSNPEKANRWSLNWFNRANQLPTANGFTPQDENNTFTLNWELLKNPKHQWRMVATYRDLKVKTTLPTTLQPEQSLLGRAQYQMNIFKGALTANVLYELGGGQEQRRDFRYFEVPAGRGEFQWIDYNNDGVPQLNEFEVSPFPDQAKYIRLFTPTNDFIRAAYNTFNYSINFNPRLLWRNSKIPLQKFLSRWSAQSALQTNRKRQNTGSFQFNPFQDDVTDTSLIALTVNVANTLSFNRYSTSWGVDLTQVRNLSRSLLTYGFETREVKDYALRIRKNFGKKYTSELATRTGTNELITPNPKFDNRNYNIRSYSMEPKLTYTNGTVFRSVLGYKYDRKNADTQSDKQNATINSFSIESKFNVVQRSILTGKFTYSQIEFNGPTNSTVAFIMLDALQPGRNLLWNFEFTRRLANAFEVTFNYEGRAAGSSRTVHIGRASLRAIL